jgi:hypothetical protein
MDTAHMGRFLQALPAALSIAALIVLALPTAASAQPNIITCTLKQDGAEFKGACDIPCAVNCWR